MESNLAFIPFMPRTHTPVIKSVSTNCSFIARPIQYLGKPNLRSLPISGHEMHRGRSITPIATAAEEKKESPSEETTDEELDVVQGPSQAPTQAGVSTAGLAEAEKRFIEACYNADVSVIEKELDQGIDVSTCDLNGRTALHFCAGNGLKTICEKLLLKKECNINKQDILGYTPMHMAAGYKMVNTVRLLVDRGADANIASFDGKLPVEIAEDLLEKTPEKKLFRPNDEYIRLQEIVEVLDQATEVEDDDDEEDEEDNGLVEEKSFIQEEGDVKYEVRIAGKKKETEEVMNKVDVKADDVKVTIRIKEPKKKE